MKLTVNFSKDPGLHFVKASMALWVLAALLVVVSISLVTAGLQGSAEISALETQLAELTKRQQTVQVQQSLPPYQKLIALKQRVQVFNELAGRGHYSSSAVLSTLEKLLPGNAYLLSLRHKRDKGEIYIIAESRSAKSLSKFLLRLEGEPRFSEVLLTKQSRQSAAKKDVTRFEIKLKEATL